MMRKIQKFVLRSDLNQLPARLDLDFAQLPLLEQLLQSAQVYYLHLDVEMELRMVNLFLLAIVL
jgi:hypothetical protein